MILNFRHILALLFVSLCLFSCRQEPGDILADIKKKYEAISASQKELKPKTVDDIITAGNGTITGYYKGDEVKEIVYELYTDTCRTFSEYYFDDGMLIYIIKRTYVYNKPASYTEEKALANHDSVWYDDKKSRLEINRFYFHKNKLIKWADPENDQADRNADFVAKESELWAETLILLKQLKEE